MTISILNLFFWSSYTSTVSPVDPENWNSIPINYNCTPEDPKYLEEVKFLLYTRKNPMTYETIDLEVPDSLNQTKFNFTKPTKILIHGWKNSYETNFPSTVKNAYLTRYDANVIVVDWSPISRQQYPQARWAVPEVARTVCRLLDLLTSAGLNSTQLHLVGYSLGAHLAGIAGLISPVKIPRITGLDPAGPLFSEDEEERLREESADYVDVIHTCGSLLGLAKPLGHADFYPNGGSFIQPGCGLDIDGQCSHGRAYLYFAESILTPEGFFAAPCPGWTEYDNGDCRSGLVEMGEYSTPRARGLYYLRTSHRTPFALGKHIFLK